MRPQHFSNNRKLSQIYNMNIKMGSHRRRSQRIINCIVSRPRATINIKVPEKNRKPFKLHVEKIYNSFANSLTYHRGKEPCLLCDHACQLPCQGHQTYL